MPSVLVVLPVVPVTYTVSFTENILEEVTVKTTEDAAEGLPEVEAPVCFRPSYSDCDPFQNSKRLFLLFAAAS